MAYWHYDRLTAVDSAFLDLEDANIHMHVGAVARFDAGPLRGESGAVDVDRIRSFVGAAFQESPRFRQRLDSVPILGHPVWSDDPRFNLLYHVRHTSLPPPGDERQLKRLAGRILSQKLDRGKPLWEMWVVEGLEEDRFALIVKAHHAMVDGIAGVDLLAALLRPAPDLPQPELHAWQPRPRPSDTRLLADELRRRASLPLAAVREAPGALRHPLGALERVRETAGALGEALSRGLVSSTPTPLNPDIGPYRRFDWCTLSIKRIQKVRKQLGGTLNDVVLATVAGAVGRFLALRGEPPTADTVFRVMVPVSIRQRSQRGVPGNRVVNFLVRLPVDETDPRRRLERTSQVTRELKESRLAQGAEILEEFSDRTYTGLVAQLLELSSSQRAFNMVVTNVPGPPRPLYLLEAGMTDIFPVVPLFKGQALGIALFSYAGQLCWGFNCCWDALPDLHEFVDGVGRAFAELHEAAAKAGEA